MTPADARGAGRRVAGLLVLLALAAGSCSSAPRAPAGSCIQQALDSLPLDGLPGDRKHCLASATIARRCGQLAAWAAGYGKEIADLFGPGRFQRRDLVANAGGRRCGSGPAGDDVLDRCCADAGF